MKVFLSGEGFDDIGDWANDLPYRLDPPAIGVIEALLRAATPTHVTIGGACAWKRIRKYRSGNHAQRETRNVLGLMIEAEELRCDVVVFVRDRDGDADRQDDIEKGLHLARNGEFTPSVVGGVAVEEMESWILALLGERESERHTDAKAVLMDRRGIAGRAAMVAIVEERGVHEIPTDAASLGAWLRQASAVFG